MPPKLQGFVKPALFCACLIPLSLMLWDGFNDQLGANPVETLTHRSGDWALRLLLLTLAITPLRRLSGWAYAVRLRRMLGLYAFFYAVIHFLIYLVVDQFFDVQEIIKDIVKRPYITVGFTAFVLLLPLALTSTNAMMRRLGKRWKQLHQLTYVVAVCAILHYLWLVKADRSQPLIYGVVLIILLALRVRHNKRTNTAPVIDKGDASHGNRDRA